jgi:hypothetical protein
MRYREILLKKLEDCNSKLKTLEFMTNTQQPINNFLITISELLELNRDIQSFIEREENTPNELNKT